MNRYAVLILLVGIIIGAGTMAISDGNWGPNSDKQNITSDIPDPGLAIASSGPSCLNETVHPHGGWVHTVAHNDGYDVTFNATIAHERTKTVNVNLSNTGSGIYEIQFTTPERANSSETAIATESGGCDVGTTITAGGTVPSEFELIRVTVNGEVVQTIQKEGTFPMLHQLPNPIEV